MQAGGEGVQGGGEEVRAGGDSASRGRGNASRGRRGGGSMGSETNREDRETGESSKT